MWVVAATAFAGRNVLLVELEHLARGQDAQADDPRLALGDQGGPSALRDRYSAPVALDHCASLRCPLYRIAGQRFPLAGMLPAVAATTTAEDRFSALTPQDGEIGAISCACSDLWAPRAGPAEPHPDHYFANDLS